MAKDIYRELQECIDQYSVGFGATESGVELKILEKLFTEEEVGMYMDLTLELESAQEVAARTKQDPAKVEGVLQGMMKKGLVFPRYPKKEGEPFYYAAAPFVHGIFEHQLKRMDKELAELVEEYIQEGAMATKQILPMRTVPVSASIPDGKSIAPYDDVRKIIKSKDRISLSDCVCAVQHKAAGHDCDQPLEVCMGFDFYADYYVATGMGRWITQEEALARLDDCEEAGLIAQFSNSENPEALCNCCAECCGALRLLKLSPQPGLLAPTNHYAVLDSELCTACGVCVDRCQMDAITMGDEVAELNRDRCIGCGVCVSSCPEDALSLKEKPEAERKTPPERCDFMKPTSEFESRFR
jgi:electron transport complex protein RnfB